MEWEEEDEKKRNEKRNWSNIWPPAGGEPVTPVKPESPPQVEIFVI